MTNIFGTREVPFHLTIYIISGSKSVSTFWYVSVMANHIISSNSFTSATKEHTVKVVITED